MAQHVQDDDILPVHHDREGRVVIDPNPYLAFGLRLGRDEAYAWIISTASTLIAAALLHFFAWNLAPSLHAAILAAVGPVAEKPGLFVHYFKEAIKEYRATAPEVRQSRRSYFFKAVREGWPSLRADLIYHDPAYTLLLWLVLRVTGTGSVVGAALLASVCFMTAVVLASALEVVFVDIMYRRLKWRLHRAGFVHKSYYETRFMVDPEGDENFSASKVLDRLQERFQLPVRVAYNYRDLYLTANSLSVYNGRRPYLRFRRRVKPNGTVSKQAVQVMYTRAREVSGREPALYRCFATLKEKAGYDFGLDQPMPWAVDDIPEKRVRKLVRKFSDAQPDREVRFRRHVATQPQNIFISVDMPPQTSTTDEAYWIEVKTHHDLDMLRMISDFISWKLPVRATTDTKCDAIADWMHYPLNSQHSPTKC